AQVRAVGSGHSWADVAVTGGFLFRPERLDKILPRDPSLLRPEVDRATLVQVESGMRIRELNRELDARGLALANMGGYDGQTFVGAISTSTHGSGLAFGPLSDAVESIDLVASGGAVYRVERSAGITDAAQYQRLHPDRKLVQSDDWFNAVVVGMGCMGVIYSVILRVTRKYWLKEVRSLSTWDRVKADLRAGDVLKVNRHYEILINPHKVQGRHRCLITTRNPIARPTSLPADKASRNFLSELFASLPFVQRLITKLLRRVPEITDEVIDGIIESLVDDAYINVSYKVLNIGVANEIPAISAEIGVPLQDGAYLAAVDRFLELVAEHKHQLGWYHTAPVSLRFVRASPAFLSMMQDRETCMIEIIMAKGTRGAAEMMRRYESELYTFSGRPHWGQINSLVGGRDLLCSLYPLYERWMDVHRTLNAAGTFASPFARRAGFAEG
ncbi:MAG: D-arabinono-1,4-lactone oxidase, partial [Acidimicrobiales bacterium]